MLQEIVQADSGSAGNNLQQDDSYHTLSNEIETLVEISGAP